MHVPTTRRLGRTRRRRGPARNGRACRVVSSWVARSRSERAASRDAPPRDRGAHAAPMVPITATQSHTARGPASASRRAAAASSPARRRRRARPRRGGAWTRGPLPARTPARHRAPRCARTRPRRGTRPRRPIASSAAAEVRTLRSAHSHVQLLGGKCSATVRRSLETHRAVSTCSSTSPIGHSATTYEACIEQGASR